MFLKLDTYFLQPNTETTVKLFNGTFERSENIITRDRMLDVSLVGNGERTKVDTALWTDVEKTSILTITTGGEGTWVAGVSTRARNIELEAKAFNDYLKHDGVLDILESREQHNTLEEDAVEKYSKHVKTIFQVGEQTTADWKTVLGYPIEFVPLQNPYETKEGSKMKLKLLRNGNPLAGQLVYAGNETMGHSHGEGEDHAHHHVDQYRTDQNGIVTVDLNVADQWFVRTIAMEELEEEGLTHESNWATLTFEIASEEKKINQSPTDAENTADVDQAEDSSNLNYGLLFLAALTFGLLVFFLTRRSKEES